MFIFILIGQECPHLCFLEIIHGPGIDKKGVELLCEKNGLSSLTSLILNFTPSTHVALGHLLECRRQLQRVDLHITLSSYFTPIEASKFDNINSYETIIKNLKVKLIFLIIYNYIIIDSHILFCRDWKNKIKAEMFFIFLNITLESNKKKLN